MENRPRFIQMVIGVENILVVILGILDGADHRESQLTFEGAFQPAQI